MKSFFGRPPVLPSLASYSFYPSSFPSDSSVDSIHSPRSTPLPPVSITSPPTLTVNGKISFILTCAKRRAFILCVCFPFYSSFLFIFTDGGLLSPISPLNLSTSFTFARHGCGVTVSSSSLQSSDASLPLSAPAKRLALRSRTPSPSSSYVPSSTVVGDIPPYVPTPLSSPVTRRLPSLPPLPDSSSSLLCDDDPVPLTIDTSVETR